MNAPTQADVTRRLAQHTAAAQRFIEQSAFAQPRIAAVKRLTEQQAQDAMVNTRDLADSPSIDRRLYWFRLMELCRREYVKLQDRTPSPVADYLPGGEVHERHAGETNNGFDAEHLDVLPEDEQ